jgi:diaminohydroxyphosphoribosylaminopyrimidine deaminase/5-amino-6-(5-phosphoribosylamino)uracil reductase
VMSTARDTPTWVFTSHKASPIAEDILQQRGAKVFRVDEQNGRLDLDAVLKVLAEQGITRLLVEGGPTVAASFVAADLVDEAVLLHTDKTIGPGGIEALEGMPLAKLTEGMTSRGVEQLGADTIEVFEKS